MQDSAHSFDELIGPLEGRMIRIVWRITRNREDAEDALQNALLTIWKRWPRVVGHCAPAALVLKVCVDAAFDVRRRRTRDRRNLNGALPAEAAGAAATDDVAGREACEKILAAIHSLSQQQAAAISLRVFEDLTYDQIAAALGCAEATARKHVERARSRLRLVLEQYEPSLKSRNVQ